ncbi:MAG: hypothetical protein R2932_55330 [Caldilineaceae bacterium]
MPADVLSLSSRSGRIGALIVALALALIATPFVLEWYYAADNPLPSTEAPCGSLAHRGGHLRSAGGAAQLRYGPSPRRPSCPGEWHEMAI